jgi:phage pi2 protein 07
MKIHFTKKEYEHLIELLFLGEWMMTAHDNKALDLNTPHQQLIQKIYSHSKAMQADDKIAYSNETNCYSPTKVFEDHSVVFKCIDHYDEESFWQELVSRMGKRDLAQIVDHENLSKDERFKLLCQFEDKWADELFTHGLTRLKVDVDTPQLD